MTRAVKLTDGMRITPEISGVGIVLVGEFKPATFTPVWFSTHGLLPEPADKGTQSQVLQEQVVAAFSTEWLRLEVTPNRFLGETLQAPHIRLRDFVVRVFKEQLDQTPLVGLGINRQVHFQVKTSAVRDRIGRRLAPVEPWGAWKDILHLDGKYGGMTSLTMSQRKPVDRLDGGSINVKIEPSNRIGQGGTGVYVAINDHYAGDLSEPGSTRFLVELLEDNFETSLRRSDGIIDHVMSLGDTPEV